VSELNAVDTLEIADAGTGRVSVIIPAYNATSYIVEALESVFAQTYAAYQVVVVNDGSPDTEALEEALRPYRDRITYVVQENRGLSGARNSGLRVATGDMIALLDADDIWLPNYLEEQVEYLQAHTDCDMVYCDALFFGASVHDGVKYMDLCPSEGDATAAAIISRRCHVFVSVTARTRVLTQLGFDETLRSCEDFDCWIRLTAAGYKIGYQRKILVRYRKHATSLSANPGRMAEYNLRVLIQSLKLWPEGSTEFELLQQAIAGKRAELENILGKLALRNRDIPAALGYLQSANEYYKSSKVAAIIRLIRLAPGLVRTAFTIREKLFPAHREG
jgi:glycosyltransferase involved in cell wall biosynthesis